MLKYCIKSFLHKPFTHHLLNNVSNFVFWRDSIYIPRSGACQLTIILSRQHALSYSSASTNISSFNHSTPRYFAVKPPYKYFAVLFLPCVSTMSVNSCVWSSVNKTQRRPVWLLIVFFFRPQIIFRWHFQISFQLLFFWMSSSLNTLRQTKINGFDL